MKRKTLSISAVWISLLLIGTLSLTFNIQPAKSDWTSTETIYIRADGSVDPHTAPISTVDNMTYTLTDDIVGDYPQYSRAIAIERDNIAVDGAGHTVQGTRVWNSRGIDLTERNNVTIKRMKIVAFYFGIDVLRSSNNTISGNDVTANYWAGISIIDSSNNTIAKNNIIAKKNMTSSDLRGIYFESSSKNIVSGNNIKNSSRGIDLDSSSFNTITRNNIRNNTYGIMFWHSNNNTISENDIVNNGKDLGPGYRPSGISIAESFDNKIYHNNFINNFEQAYVALERNVWDNGYPSGGNYWSDYKGADANGDGIGDTSYTIYANNQDRYPLMNPWTPPSAGVKTGNWIKCTYTISGWSAGTPYPEWLKVEFTSVEGTSATVRVTMHLSDGSEQNATVPVDVVAGGQALGLAGFLIPANCTTSDCIYMSGYGNVTIEGETTRTYAGASRTVVYASFSQLGNQLTYYWDKQTGVMVEASTISGSTTATSKATETNMWQAQNLQEAFPIWIIGVGVAAIVVVVVATILFLRKRKQPP